MATGIYIGDGNRARKVKGVYIGVGNKARKVTKGYIGVDGKARLMYKAAVGGFYHSMRLSSSYNFNVAASFTAGNYALFTGDINNNAVDAYDTALTCSTPTALSQARYFLAATSVGNYVLFGGGACYGSISYTNPSNVVDAYDTALTRSTPTALSQARQYLGATSVGNYALFGGGNHGGSPAYDIIDAYDTALTRSTPTALSYAQNKTIATSVGNYALFIENNSTAIISVHDVTLTLIMSTSLSQRRWGMGITSLGNYALFAGGNTLVAGGNGQVATVEAISTALTRSTPTALSEKRDLIAATSVGNYALFGGGTIRYAGGVSFAEFSLRVDAYDTALTRSTLEDLFGSYYPRNNFLAASVGKHALFRTKNSTGAFIEGLDVYTLA